MIFYRLYILFLFHQISCNGHTQAHIKKNRRRNRNTPTRYPRLFNRKSDHACRCVSSPFFDIYIYTRGMKPPICVHIAICVLFMCVCVCMPLSIL